MNGPLQRLIAGARGAAATSERRIEPLLNPRYALAQGRHDEPALHEEPAQTSAAQAGAVSRAAALARDPSPSPPVRVIAPMPTPQADARPSAPPQGEAAFSTAIAHDPIASPALPLAPTSAVTRDQAREQTTPTRQIEQETLVSGAMTTARTPPSARDIARTMRERAPPERQATRDAPSAVGIVEENPPSITISIGRIDVHGAPPPAAPPAPTRRAAFRPGVSLDAFLHRGGSDER